MRITYLGNSGSIHTIRWARHFAARGHEVTVLSFSSSMIDGIRTEYFPSAGSGPRVNYWIVLPSLRNFLKKEPPDILHAHYATSYGLAGAVCNHHPFVVTAWGDDVLIDPERSWPYRMLVRWVMSRADLVTSMAGHMTELIVKRGYAERERILTLPFGVDASLFSPERRHSEVAPSGMTVISTRHLAPEYDVETLIRAVPIILSKLPGTRFRIVGAGECRSYLEGLSATLGLAKSVDFLGSLEHHVLAGMLGEADIFVSTSRSDGNNISLNEAMACGAFPVVSDIPANREWIVDGENGLFFPVGNATKLAEQVIIAAARPDLRYQAAEKNWRIIQERGSWEVNMQRMEKAYKQLLGTE